MNTAENLAAVVEFLKGLEALDNNLASDLYLQGKIEIWNSNGFRLGYAVSYEDWWIFEPDYFEPLDSDG